MKSGFSFGLMVLLGLSFLLGDEVLATPSLDIKTTQILQTAQDFYIGLSGFQVDGSIITAHKSAAFEEGENGTFSIAMSRPSSFNFVGKYTLRNFDYIFGDAFVSNGETLAAYDSYRNGYTLFSPPSKLSELFHTKVDVDRYIYGVVLGNWTVFDELLAEHPFQRAVGQKTGAYVGVESIGGTNADHIHLEMTWPTKAITDDLWFSTGPSPLLLQWRVSWRAIFLPGVLDKPLQEGWNVPQGEETFTFTNWRINPEIPAEQFVFQPPSGTVLLTKSAWSNPVIPKTESTQDQKLPSDAELAKKQAQYQAQQEDLQRREEGMKLEKLWHNEGTGENPNSGNP